VLRTVALSIVLTLAGAPEAPLLCKAWCHPQVASASACHHGLAAAGANASDQGEPAASSASGDVEGSAAPSVVWDATCPYCDKGGLVAVPFLREDGRRSVSALNSLQAILVPRYQFAPSTTHSRAQHESGRDWSPEGRHLPSVLRV
jgi:hypothetical protein